MREEREGRGRGGENLFDKLIKGPLLFGFPSFKNKISLKKIKTKNEKRNERKSLKHKYNNVHIYSNTFWYIPK